MTTTTTTTALVPGCLDVTRLTVASFLAGYRGADPPGLHPGPQGVPRLVPDLRPGGAAGTGTLPTP
ncbi:MAG: hypothetical protein ACXVXO_09970 [Mycobacteriaceae bacterium]